MNKLINFIIKTIAFIIGLCSLLIFAMLSLLLWDSKFMDIGAELIDYIVSTKI